MIVTLQAVNGQSKISKDQEVSTESGASRLWLLNLVASHP